MLLFDIKKGNILKSVALVLWINSINLRTTKIPLECKMKCILAVIWSVVVFSQQYHCYTDEDLAEALWSDTNSMLRRSEMNEICRFLLRNGNGDIGRSSNVEEVGSLVQMNQFGRK